MRVRDDLFHVSKRLKEIDSRYELYFNRRHKRFEVYVGGVMQVALPFDRLDARTLEHIRKTRVERIELIEKEIEELNDRARANEERAAKERAFELAGV